MINIAILTVYDVGHGNYNSISTDDDQILFDLGAGKHLNKCELNTHVSNYFHSSDKSLLIISHWDVDHINLILALSNNQIRLIKAVIAPIPPSTSTCKRIIKRFNDESVELFLISPINKLLKGVEVELGLVYTYSFLGKEPIDLYIYRSSGSSNKNLDSIVTYVETNNNRILLTGDNHYNKAIKYVLDKSKGLSTPLYTVVPHHGGEAGKIDSLSWKSHSLYKLICSRSDSNKYNHTLHSVLNKFPWCVVEETNGTGSKINVV
ncbi:hypothetical protein MKY91_17195 [Alkalicoccobacillus gibsonii]|uniref:Metallo-beta-lactamase domain-containing protein n=1 Tax=Alkalicoccobacillus gibsonii TaxID=79881 RepID=A0ABU9VLW1_9BACI